MKDQAKESKESKESKDKSFAHRRKYTRFPSGKAVHAEIDVGTDLNQAFAPTIAALVTDEAYQGCGLVLLSTESLQLHQVCRVQLGRQSPMVAEVRWRQELHPQVIRVGLMYKE